VDLFEHARLMGTRFDRGANYPQSPGYRQTDTSKAAAESMKPSKAILRAAVLNLLYPALCVTADEAADILGIDKLSIRPRFSELREEGLIVDTGDRRRNDSGRKAIVWRLAPKH
jgi:predicted ArsR family transcriptional regulator